MTQHGMIATSLPNAYESKAYNTTHWGKFLYSTYLYYQLPYTIDYFASFDRPVPLLACVLWAWHGEMSDEPWSEGNSEVTAVILSPIPVLFWQVCSFEREWFMRLAINIAWQ